MVVRHVALGLGCFVCVGCTSLTPHQVLNKPPREIPELEDGQSVAQLTEQGIHIIRSEITDYKPLDCAPIARMRENYVGYATRRPAISIYGAGMQTSGHNPYAANFQKYDSALRKCQSAQQSYREGAVRLVAVNTTGPVVPIDVVARTGFDQAAGNGHIKTQAVMQGGQDHSCFALQDWHGRLLPVRTDQTDPYRFRYDTARKAVIQQNAQSTRSSSRSTLADVRASHRELKSRLESNTAFVSGQCIKPAQRPIPPKPTNVMSAEKVEYHSVGGCMKQIYSTFKNSEASDAFGRYGLYREMDLARTWSVNKGYNESSCGLNHLSQSEMQNAGISVWSANIGLRRSAADSIKSLYDRCIIRAQTSCGGEMIAWEVLRELIVAEPGELMASCESDAAKMEVMEALLTATEVAIKSIEADMDATEAFAASLDTSMGDAATSRCTGPTADELELVSRDGLPPDGVVDLRSALR